MEFDLIQALMPGFKAALGSPLLWGALVYVVVRRNIARWFCKGF